MINVSSFLLSIKYFIFNRMWNFGTLYYRYYSKKVHKKFMNNFGVLGSWQKFQSKFNQKWTINAWFFSFFTKYFIFNSCENLTQYTTDIALKSSQKFWNFGRVDKIFKKFQSKVNDKYMVFLIFHQRFYI